MEMYKWNRMKKMSECSVDSLADFVLQWTQLSGGAAIEKMKKSWI